MYGYVTLRRVRVTIVSLKKTASFKNYEYVSILALAIQHAHRTRVIS